jgi:glutamine synthetase
VWAVTSRKSKVEPCEYEEYGSISDPTSTSPRSVCEMRRAKDPDIAAMPDPASFTPVPWQPNLARFACDVYVEGEPCPFCPRTILKRNMARARERDYVFKIGMEAEFFLTRLGEDGTIAVADALDTLDRPCYDMRALSRQYDFITTLSKYESQLGWDNYANDHEDANGQFESNFVFTDALTTSDRVIFFRLHGALARAARSPGHVHAEAVRASHRQRAPHVHEPVGPRDRHEPVRGRGGPTGTRHLRARLPLGM